MSEYSITVEGGTSKRLLTAGKYCDRDIVVTAEGGGGGDVPETCTVTFVDDLGFDCKILFMVATCVENGTRKTYCDIKAKKDASDSCTLQNVVCGTPITMMAVWGFTSNGVDVTIDGSAIFESWRLFDEVNGSPCAVYEFTAPLVANESCTIHYCYAV